MFITIVLLGIAAMLLDLFKAEPVEVSEWDKAYADGLALFDVIASSLSTHTVESIDECGSPVRKTMVVRNGYVLRYDITSNYAMRTACVTPLSPVVAMNASHTTAMRSAA